ncbi:MAG: trimethylamine methyltransferase family protein [Bacillota bacterium]|nr:trimethylamine methyltransferase family protein [Bacillota bacterium]
MPRNMRIGLNYLEGFGLNVLSRDQLDTIHFATLEVFKNTGIKVECDEAVKIFQEAGAGVEWREGHAIVKIPPHVIEDCIRWSPPETIYYGRIPEHDFVAEPNRVGHSTFGECVQIIDPETRKIKKSVKEDLAKFIKLCDYYDEISVMARPLCSTDKPAETQPLHNLDAIVHNTSKHVLIGPHAGRNVAKLRQIAAAAVGDMELFKRRPSVTMFVCPITPLTMGKDCCEITIETARLGLGLAVIPMALSGATSAVTLAGTLITHNVETLSAIILAQLVRKGTPCTYCSMSTIMDLKKMVGAVGTPELGILSAGAIKLAQYYQLPSFVGGGISDSKIPDAQVGYEYAMNCLLGSLSGGNVVYGAGALELGLTIDFAKLVMDVDMIAYVQRILRGYSITDEQLAVDLIHSVGPAGEFMSASHTFNHMREQSHPRIFDRSNRSAWESDGHKDAAERAYEEAAAVLSSHKPKALPEGASAQIKMIIDDFEKELGISSKK